MDADGDDDMPDAGRSRWRRLLAPSLFRRPKDMLSLCLALAATAAIAINALFLQAGPHPAPIFADLPRPSMSGELTSSVTAVLPRPRPMELDRSRTDRTAVVQGATAKPVPIGTAASASLIPARPDPIAALIEPSNRVMAIQRALAEFGYGQIKPTGISDLETKAAIEKFEREHKLPVTGQMSERLARELTVMKGGPL
jgi:hypothetical protein